MNEAKARFKGCGVAMVTPFSADGKVDFEKLEQHTDRLIVQGVDSLVVLGTTAETPVLNASEKSEIVATVVKAASGRVPIMVGAGGNDTRSVVEGMKNANREGVSAWLSVVPYYNKPTQEGIYRHFSAIAASTSLPVLLYNVPGRTGSNMRAETVLRLAADYPDVVMGVKEASGDFSQISALLRDRPDDFLVLSGDDALTLPMMGMGGEGVISVIGNAYPAEFSAMVHAALDGRFDEARRLHYQLFPMMEAIFMEGNPAGVKAAMEIKGWIENVLRLPLVPASKELFGLIAQIDKGILG